jgi:hypothetical protein
MSVPLEKCRASLRGLAVIREYFRCHRSSGTAQRYSQWHGLVYLTKRQMAAMCEMQTCPGSRFRPFAFACDVSFQSANRYILSFHRGSGYIQVAHGCTRPTMALSHLVGTGAQFLLTADCKGTYFARATRVTLAFLAMRKFEIQNDILRRTKVWPRHPCSVGLRFVVER